MVLHNNVRVCIVCFKGDVHAEIISGILTNKYSSQVEFLHPETCANSISLSYNTDENEKNINNYDVVWLRRKNTLHVTENEFSDARLFINVAQSNQDAVHEFLNLNKSRCVNDPDHALLIENKATQLRIGRESGLHIPPTIVSANYEEILKFNSTHSPTVIKNMRSFGGEPTSTFEFNKELINRKSCEKSFAIYQKMIAGSEHYRIVVFGNKIFPFLYHSKNIDSRIDARDKAELVALDPSTQESIIKFLEKSGLKMGVFDFKKSLEGITYFLEINQQGSFAYLDPLAGVPILKEFAYFLYQEAKKA